MEGTGVRRRVPKDHFALDECPAAPSTGCHLALALALGPRGDSRRAGRVLLPSHPRQLGENCQGLLPKPLWTVPHQFGYQARPAADGGVCAARRPNRKLAQYCVHSRPVSGLRRAGTEFVLAVHPRLVQDLQRVGHHRSPDGGRHERRGARLVFGGGLAGPGPCHPVSHGTNECALVEACVRALP
jgi:hypothetical protein